jgi:prevent-host-death family protein
MRISSADFQRQFGALSDKALTEPLTITRNGRDRLVLLSVKEYERLKRRDRRVVRLEDFTEEEMALIAKADVPAEHAHLDAELKDRHREPAPKPDLVIRYAYLWESEAREGREEEQRIAPARSCSWLCAKATIRSYAFFRSRTPPSNAADARDSAAQSGVLVSTVSARGGLERSE